MAIDTRTLKVGDELRIWMTGRVGDLRARVVGHSERHGGTAVLRIVDPQTGDLAPGLNLKGDDYIARGMWP